MMWATASVQRGRIRKVVSDGAFEPKKLVQWLGPCSVKRSRNPIFMYNEEGRGLDVGASRFACEVVTMSPSELLATSGWYHYMTAPLSQRGLDCFDGWHDLVKGERGAYASVWIGTARATTQAHYDVADNVLCQASGTKRVRVWPPSQHWSMHVFPDAHPRARKAQVDVDEDDPSFALRRQLQSPMLDVVLQPGDALRIPAFWFHHCEALELSVSLNVFAPSRAARAAAAVLGSSIPPLDRGLDLIGKFASCEGDSFLRRLYVSRFEPLMKAYEALHLDDHVVEKNPLSLRRQRPIAPAPSQPPLEDGAERVLRLLGSCRDAAGPEAAEGVAEITVAHLLELWGMHWHRSHTPSLAAWLKALGEF